MKKLGFTLVEIMVVISIIAILMALGSVSYTVAQRKARDASRKADIKAISNGFEQYYSTTNSYPANCSTLSSDTQYFPGGYPVDPKPSASYTTTCTSNTYCVCALLEVDTGNTVNADCNYATSGTKRNFCISSLQ